MNPSQALRPVRVWDLPTRLFHWLLAAAVLGMVITGKLGGNAMVWHVRLGLLVFTLLGFRLVWGLIGGRWSRFASFIYAPSTLLGYLRGRSMPDRHLDVGHSPLGALSVFGFLGVLIAQVATGLVADDEIATVGPLNVLVSNATGLQASGWHTGWGLWLLLALVALHLVSIAVYRWRGRDLVTPMLSGDKLLPSDVPAAADSAARRLLALLVLLAFASLAVWIARQGG